VYPLLSSDYEFLQLYSRTPLLHLVSLLDVGGSVQSIVFDLEEKTATGLTFKDMDIHTFNQNSDPPTVVCDPNDFSTDDLNNLGFECRNGVYAASD
jgi:hypothetical protein